MRRNTSKLNDSFKEDDDVTIEIKKVDKKDEADDFFTNSSPVTTKKAQSPSSKKNQSVNIIHRKKDSLYQVSQKSQLPYSKLGKKSLGTAPSKKQSHHSLSSSLRNNPYSLQPSHKNSLLNVSTAANSTAFSSSGKQPRD